MDGFIGTVLAGCLAAVMTCVAPAEAAAADASLRFTLDPAAVIALSDNGDDASSELNEASTHAAAPFGDAYTWRWAVRGGYGVDLRQGDNRLAQIGLGVSYFIVDQLSLETEINAVHFDQDGPDALAGNINLLFRWHFVLNDDFSIFTDAGVGLMGSTERVPQDGSRFNFVPQAGGGFTVNVGGGTRLVTGVRWHHVSNSNLFRSNPGRDSLMVYTGFSFPF